MSFFFFRRVREKENSPFSSLYPKACTATTTAGNLGEPGLFYARTAPRSERERAAARKAARLALDTSAHGGASFARLVRAFEDEAREASVHGGSIHGGLGVGRRKSGEMTAEELWHKPAGSGGGSSGTHAVPPPPPPPSSSPSLPAAPSNSLAAVAPSLPSASPPRPSLAVEMGGRRRQGVYAAFLAKSSEEGAKGGGSGAGGGQGSEQRGPPLPLTALQLSSSPPPPSASAFNVSAGRQSNEGRKQVTFSPVVDVPKSGAAAAARPPARTSAAIIADGDTVRNDDGDENDGAAAPASSSPPVPVISLRLLRDVMRALSFSRGEDAVTTSALADGLARLGYELEPSEARVLAEQVAPAASSSAAAAASEAAASAEEPQQQEQQRPSSLVPKAAFVASQLDWGSIATNYRDQWLAAAEKVFGDLRQQAGGGSGKGGESGSGNGDSALLPASALTAALRDKLPAAEVAHAVEDALLATGAADTEALDFEGFLRMLRCGGVAVGVGEHSRRGGGGAGPAGSNSKVEGSVHAGLEFFDSRYRGPAAHQQQQQTASPARRASGEHGGGGGGLSGAGGGLDPVAE